MSGFEPPPAQNHTDARKLATSTARRQLRQHGLSYLIYITITSVGWTGLCFLYSFSQKLGTRELL